jgi:putative transposase
MPRRPRSVIGGFPYHVLNRGNAKAALFDHEADYRAFMRILMEARARHPIPILAYCLMPNHWHFLLWPPRTRGRTLTLLFHWLTMTHAQRLHAHRHTCGSGHVYQGRFKSFPVQEGAALLTVARYIERNPLRAGLVDRAEKWPWSSLHARLHGSAEEKAILADIPDLPRDWILRVNRPETPAELESLRVAVNRGRPFGERDWARSAAAKCGLESTLREKGRPAARGT